MRYKNLEWYKRHPEVLVRHHGERWTELQIHVLKLLFRHNQPLSEMTRMLGRTDYGVLAQLSRQKLIWWDKNCFCYRVRDRRAPVVFS